MLEETLMMLPDCNKRLKNALDALETMLGSEEVKALEGSAEHTNAVNTLNELRAQQQL